MATARVFCWVFVILHVALLSRWYSGDALYYVLAFQEPDWGSANFMLPQHPLWNVLGTWIYEGYAALGYRGGPLELIQLVNTVVGALALWQFFRLLRDLECDEALSGWVTVWLGATYCFWFYASDVKMYSWVSLLIFVVLRLALQASREGFRPRTLVLLGLASTVLMLLHVTSYYLTPVVLAMLLSGPGGWGSRLKSLALAGGVFLSTLLLGYGLSYLPLVGMGQGTFWEWLTSPARAAYPGLLRDQYWVSLSFFFKRFFSSMTGTIWYPHPPAQPGLLYSLGWLLSDWYSRIFFVLLCLAPATGLVRPRPGSFSREGLLVILWVGCSIVGFGTATPDSDYVFGLWAPLMAGLAFGVPKPIFVRMVAALACVLFALNLWMRWIPAAQPRNNPQLARALDAKQIVPPGALLVSLRDSSYYAYFAGADTLDLYVIFQQFWNHPAVKPLEFVQGRIDAALDRGRPVFLNADVFDEPYDFFIMPAGLGFNKGTITKWFEYRYDLGEPRGSSVFRVYELRRVPARAGEGPQS